MELCVTVFAFYVHIISYIASRRHGTVLEQQAEDHSRILSQHGVSGIQWEAHSMSEVAYNITF